MPFLGYFDYDVFLKRTRPPPTHTHFHAECGDHKAAIQTFPLEILKGRLPARLKGLVIEWAATHQLELLEDWKRAEACQDLKQILPLGMGEEVSEEYQRARIVACEP